MKRLDEKQRSQLYSELKALHDKVGMKYDSNIVNRSILQTFGKYWRGNEIKCNKSKCYSLCYSFYRDRKRDSEIFHFQTPLFIGFRLVAGAGIEPATS